MKQVSKLSIDPANERQLYFLDLAGPDDLPSQLGLSSSNFYCIIAWDSERADVETISRFAESLIREGAAYFCTWGPGCERVHDIIDEIDSYPFNDLGSPESSVIMTTWHAEDSLEEALYFFLNSTWVDQHYESTSLSSLAISVGSEAWKETIMAALRSPRAFSDYVAL